MISSVSASVEDTHPVWTGGQCKYLTKLSVEMIILEVDGWGESRAPPQSQVTFVVKDSIFLAEAIYISSGD